MKLHEVIDIHIDIEDLFVQKENILALLGYGNNSADSHVSGIIDLCIEESLKVIDPQGSVIILKNNSLSIPEGKLQVGGQELNIDKIIASQLKYTEYISLFISTIGKGVELLSKIHMDKGELLEGYIYDLIGSEAAEETSGYVHEEIKHFAAKDGLHITNRFSPGYCNWSVKEQFKLFSFFPEGYCGIKLTDSALMNPVKSVSGLVGIGERVKFNLYKCSLCSDKNCIYRNRKNSN